MDKASGFINRTLSFRPADYKLLGTLAELDDRSMSATARRLIETEAATRRDEIDKYLRTQSRKTAA